MCIWSRLIASQERRARKIVNDHLSRMDDQSLRSLGYNPEVVRTNRKVSSL